MECGFQSGASGQRASLSALRRHGARGSPQRGLADQRTARTVRTQEDEEQEQAVLRLACSRQLGAGGIGQRCGQADLYALVVCGPRRPASSPVASFASVSGWQTFLLWGNPLTWAEAGNHCLASEIRTVCRGRL